VEPEAAWRKLVKPTQVLHDRDASRQQRRVHRARLAAGVVDVERVDADQSCLLLNQPVGGGSGEEGSVGSTPSILWTRGGRTKAQGHRQPPDRRRPGRSGAGSGSNDVIVICRAG
jgi:hypothetical protein